MCMESLRKSECLNEECTFNHIKGTRRQPKLVMNNQSTRVQNQPSNTDAKPPGSAVTNNSNADHFLEVVRLLKAEILTTMNSQIATLTNQIKGLQQVQAQTPQIPYYPPAMFPHMQSRMNPQLLITPQMPQRTQPQTATQPAMSRIPAPNHVQTPAPSHLIPFQQATPMVAVNQN